MKLNKREDQGVDASILLRRGNKIIMGGRGREGPWRESYTRLLSASISWHLQ